MKATSEELAIFVSVVESGSFSRAAEQLGQANSAVSRACLLYTSPSPRDTR